jgi:hypothetical protein
MSTLANITKDVTSTIGMLHGAPAASPRNGNEAQTTATAAAAPRAEIVPARHLAPSQCRRAVKTPRKIRIDMTQGISSSEWVDWIIKSNLVAGLASAFVRDADQVSVGIDEAGVSGQDGNLPDHGWGNHYVGGSDYDVSRG